MNAFAAIFAGGKGYRYGDAPTPKQFVTLAGYPVILHVLFAIAGSQSIRDVVIGAEPAWHDFLSKHLAHDDLQNLRVVLVNAGETAHQTRLACLEWAQSSLVDNPIAVLVDAVRPLVQASDFDRATDLARSCGSAIAVKPSVETIVYTAHDSGKTASLPRSRLRVAAAPQAASLDGCLRSHRSLNEANQPDEAIDLCSLLIAHGVQPHFFQTTPENFKITYKTDLLSAEAILRNRRRL